MLDCTGWIVRSGAGHDKNDLFCVVGSRDSLLLLANGKQRKAAKPKAKKAAPVEPPKAQKPQSKKGWAKAKPKKSGKPNSKKVKK